MAEEETLIAKPALDRSGDKDLMGKKRTRKQTSLVAHPPTNPLDAAQEVIYEAWKATSARRRISLAKKALQISPDCADAYVLLAEQTARTYEEGIRLYSKGVEAGERALGEESFREDVGYFWSILETRSYMRARAGLARFLWLSGEKEDAIGHYKDMLRLNPGDNQGIRDLLMTHLLDLRRLNDAEKLYREYDDDGMAAWAYSRALLDFLKEGGSSTAEESLKTAIATNAHVPQFLFGKKKTTSPLPSYYGFGDENEAVLYLFHNARLWREIPGALDWLGSNTG